MCMAVYMRVMWLIRAHQHALHLAFLSFNLQSKGAPLENPRVIISRGNKSRSLTIIEGPHLKLHQVQKTPVLEESFASGQIGPKGPGQMARLGAEAEQCCPVGPSDGARTVWFTFLISSHHSQARSRVLATEMAGPRRNRPDAETLWGQCMLTAQACSSFVTHLSTVRGRSAWHAGGQGGGSVHSHQLYERGSYILGKKALSQLWTRHSGEL